MIWFHLNHTINFYTIPRRNRFVRSRNPPADYEKTLQKFHVSQSAPPHRSTDAHWNVVTAYIFIIVFKTAVNMSTEKRLASYGPWWINPIELGFFTVLCLGSKRNEYNNFGSGNMMMTHSSEIIGNNLSTQNNMITRYHEDSELSSTYSAAAWVIFIGYVIRSNIQVDVLHPCVLHVFILSPSAHRRGYNFFCWRKKRTFSNFKSD